MKKETLLPVVAVFIVGLGSIYYLETASTPYHVSSLPPPAGEMTSEGVAASSSYLTSGCVSINGLPDANCNPGSVDLNCSSTQAKTPGYSATVRPPVNVTNAEKKVVMHEYGMDGQDLKTVEGDHLIPISLCGCPGPGHQCDFHANFWPESWDGPLGAHMKDAVELNCLKAVRAGTLSLSDAQSQIAKNWKTACK